MQQQYIMKEILGNEDDDGYLSDLKNSQWIIELQKEYRLTDDGELDVRISGILCKCKQTKTENHTRLVA